MSEILIYYAQGQEQRGPFTVQQLLAQGLSPDTLVWYDGLTGWTPAAEAPLTAPYFGRVRPQTPPPGPGYGDNPYRNPYGNNPYVKAPGMMDPSRKPDDNLVWAILTTIFCCLPFGIVSIVYAAKVNSLWAQGLYNEARDASRKAKNWAIASAVSSLVIAIPYFLLVFLGAIAGF